MKSLFISIVLWASMCVQVFAATSVTQYGITWTFSADKTIGQYANGDYWVIGPVTVTNITPTPSYNGTRYTNGSMVNPDVNFQKHGFDNEIQGYDHTLNVGHNSLGNLNLAAGDSLISAASLASGGTLGRRVAIYAVLTVVDSAPPVDSFRPSYLKTNKVMPYTYSDVDTSSLLNLVPVSGMPEWSEAEKRILPAHPFYIREFYGSHVLPQGIGGIEYLPSYGADIARDVSALALMVNTNQPLADKRMSLIGLIQRGLDDYGQYRAYRIENNLTFPWHPDGGIKNGHKFPILFAGHLLNDSAMQNIGFIPQKFQEDAQMFYVTQAEVDATNSVNWNPDLTDGPYAQAYNASHIGMPEWGKSHTTQPLVDNAHWDARYRRGSAGTHSNAGVALTVLAMGLKSSWNHAPFFDYIHRYMAIENGDPDPFGYSVEGAPITPPSLVRYPTRAWQDGGNFQVNMFDEYYSAYYTPGGPIARHFSRGTAIFGTQGGSN